MRGAAVLEVSESLSVYRLLANYYSANADVYLGYTTWAAGGFDSTYELVETPTQSNGKWTDTALVKSCVVGSWKDT